MSDMSFPRPDGNSPDQPFDLLIAQKLAFYVYALRDPRDGRIFYIGKGGGSGAGNARVLDHFDEVRNAQPPFSAKVQRILDIWSSGQDVEWFIIRRGLYEPTAMHVEAALIDAINLTHGPADRLTNIQSGHHVDEHGMLSRQQAYLLGAQPIMPHDFSGFLNRPIFLFPIQNALQKELDTQANNPGPVMDTVLEATRRAWKVNKSLRDWKNAVAIGLVKGISQGAYRIDSWYPCSSFPDLWEFSGTELSNPNTLHPRNYYNILQPVKGFFQRGNYIVFEIRNSNGVTEIQYLRGSKNKDWQQWPVQTVCIAEPNSSLAGR